MNGHVSWMCWLLIGCLPYAVERFSIGDEYNFSIKALFWSVEISSRKGRRHRWKLRIPLIEQCNRVFWTTLVPVQKNSISPKEEEKALMTPSVRR